MTAVLLADRCATAAHSPVDGVRRAGRRPGCIGGPGGS